MAPHFHQPTKKEAPWALLQMRQRRSQGPLMLKAKAPSRSDIPEDELDISTLHSEAEDFQLPLEVSLL